MQYYIVDLVRYDYLLINTMISCPFFWICVQTHYVDHFTFQWARIHTNFELNTTAGAGKVHKGFDINNNDLRGINFKTRKDDF